MRCEIRAKTAGMLCNFFGKAELQSGVFATVAFKEVVWMEGETATLDQLPRFCGGHTQQLVKIRCQAYLKTSKDSTLCLSRKYPA